MTVNDKEIEVLLRRYANGVAWPTPVDHLDADELSAFAEGNLPQVARQRYVSHLADCDDCRKLVSELAIATGAAAEVRVPASQAAPESWWQKLSILLAPATLRYAAFAVVLLGVVGIAFVVWRQPEPRNADMIAQSRPETSQTEALRQESESASNRPGAGTATSSVPRPTAPFAAEQKQLESSDVNSPPPPPKPADALAAKESAPVTVGAARADDQPRAQSSPSYAPAPANENFGYMRGRENQNVSPSPGGPRRNESYDKYKEMERSRSADVAKARDEDQNRSGKLAKSKTKDADESRLLGLKQAPMSENKADDAPARTASSVPASRGRDTQERDGARKREAASVTSEEAPETRSVGGRKFKRQGSAWVDAKFKSSMSTRNITRGSEEFDKLDSGLRSIAQQLGGEIIVVWKGKAYRIR